MKGHYFQLHRERVVQILKSQFPCEASSVKYIGFMSGEQEVEPYTNSELEFLQEANFYWISGWDKPSSCIFIDLETCNSFLYIPSRSESDEIWHGKQMTKEEIIEMTGVTDVVYISEKNSFPDAMVIEETEKLQTQPLYISCCLARVEKFDHEIEQLQKASEKTGQAIIKVMKKCKPGLMEYDIESMFKYYGARLGCKYVSFQTIVGSGMNSVFLHYSENKKRIENGDLVLLDCGLFENHYAGDVTRTFPANGKFSHDQKIVYNLLLQKQKELIELVRPGRTFGELNSELVLKIYDILVELKIVLNTPFLTKKSDISKLFCPHSLSHHIGCNVHDLSIIGNSCKWAKEFHTLKSGMIISIEPGIYFNKFMFEKALKKFHELDSEKVMRYCDSVGGIRIEDDVLVTENGFKVLSSNCPKTIEEIEEIMKK